MSDFGEVEQQRFQQGIALKDAARSEAGQLYHRHLMKMIDDRVDTLLNAGLEKTDAELAGMVRQLQGLYQVLSWEGDAVQRSIQQGQRLAQKARILT